jgi:predicted membrane protein
MGLCKKMPFDIGFNPLSIFIKKAVSPQSKRLFLMQILVILFMQKETFLTN